MTLGTRCKRPGDFGTALPSFMYHRRRVLLAALAYSGGKLEKIRLQKLLFLFTRGQEKPIYDFIPHQYGCYSFQAAEDIRILAGYYGMLTIKQQTCVLNEKVAKEVGLTLKDEDRVRLKDVCDKYGQLSTDDLVYQVYQKYPYYAINSEFLDKECLKPLRGKIAQARIRPSSRATILYTIGYERTSIDQFMNRLIRNGVSLLLDVRHNPFSRKYGFSKSQLRYVTGECKIDYFHIPALGIESGNRKNLTSRDAYRLLFAGYRKSLSQKEDSLQSIQDLLSEHPRMALTCFEKDHTYCHRDSLAAAVHDRCGVKVEHL